MAVVDGAASGSFREGRIRALRYRITLSRAPMGARWVLVHAAACTYAYIVVVGLFVCRCRAPGAP